MYGQAVVKQNSCGDWNGAIHECGRPMARCSEETMTLCWSMTEETWSHWAQGRGKQTVDDVVRKELKKIRKDQQVREAVRRRCKAIESASERSTVEEARPHKIRIELPSKDWGEVCQLVGKPGCPIDTQWLLGAMILESESWKQSGSADAAHHAQFVESPMILSISSATGLTDARVVQLDFQERLIAWLLVIGTFAGVATSLLACSP